MSFKIKRIIPTLVASIAFSYSSILNAQNVLPTQQFVFDYPTSAIIDYGVRRVELKIDDGQYQPFNLPLASSGNAEFTTFKIPIPSLTPGSHTAVIRACNDVGCSADSNTYRFTLVVIPAPLNLRIE